MALWWQAERWAPASKPVKIYKLRQALALLMKKWSIYDKVFSRLPHITG